MDNNTDLTELTTAVQRCIATTDNPFAAKKPDTRQLTIQAIEHLTGQYRIADIIAVLTAEKERLTKELEYLLGFLKSVDAKLCNERFVQNAKPEIIANERNKKADAESKIDIIKESLNALNA